MAKDRATIGIDGLPLPILPPGRDARVWARLVRIMFYLPGFMGLPLRSPPLSMSRWVLPSCCRW